MERNGHMLQIKRFTIIQNGREKIGLSSVHLDLILCPHFAAVNQNEIYNHYAAVAKAVVLPIFHI